MRPDRTRRPDGGHERPTGSFYAGDWLVEPQLARMSRDGVPVHVRPQLLDLLGFLAGRPDEVLSKDEILAAVWPGQFVVESALARCVAELRRLLGDCARDPHIIQTVTKRGYRLVARITWVGSDATPGASGSARQARAVAPGDTGASANLGAVRDSGTLATRAPGRIAGPARRVVRWAVVACALAVAAGSLSVSMLSAKPPVSRTAGSVRLLVADFTNRTGDPGLVATVRLALAAELQESGFLEVLSDSESRSALRNLERPVDTPIAAAVAMEVCADQAADAFVGGSLAPFGGRLALGLEVIACGTGEVLARSFVEARDRGHVLQALDTAAQGLARKLAASLPSLRRAERPRGPVLAEARQGAQNPLASR